MVNITNYDLYLQLKQQYIDMKGGDKPIEISIREPWFSLIKNKKKTVEGRLNRGIFANIKKNDHIKFICDNKSIEVTIVDIKNYASFEGMLFEQGLDKVLPDPKVKSVLDGVAVYRKFYKEDDEEKYGIVAIIVQVV